MQFLQNVFAIQMFTQVCSRHIQKYTAYKNIFNVLFTMEILCKKCKKKDRQFLISTIRLPGIFEDVRKVRKLNSVVRPRKKTEIYPLYGFGQVLLSLRYFLNIVEFFIRPRLKSFCDKNFENPCSSSKVPNQHLFRISSSDT